MGSPYVMSYRGSHDFPVPAEGLWERLGRLEEFPAWCSWLREFEGEGGLRAGAVLRGLIVPPVPFRMRVEVEFLACDPPRRIEAAVRGDLVGPASLDVVASEHGCCSVTVSWAVEMKQAPMRAMARIAFPLLRRAHDWVVGVTVARFRRELLAGAGPSAQPGDRQGGG